MIGIGVRERFEEGSGAPAFVAVEQDATGHAWPKALALAKAIGATRAGALGLTFAEETEMDLFMEQGVWPVITRVLILAFEILTKQGFPAEAVIMELYGSGEAAQIFKEMAEVGLFQQMSFHSQTSQYGTLSRGPKMLPDNFRVKMQEALNAIRDGSFATEWEAEQKAGYPEFKRLKETGLAHPINEAEKSLQRIVGGE
jgi:ketol-acid reductoisomerase